MKQDIMKVGDLVKIVLGTHPPYLRPISGSVGMIVEVKETSWLGVHYCVYINDVGWRFYPNELEVINGNR